MNPTPLIERVTSTILTTEFGSRLIALHDGRRGLRCTLQVESQATAEPGPASLVEHPEFGDAHEDVKDQASGPAPAIIEFLSSTEALDRYGEIICANGWRLDNYRRNPVFQNSHQYGDILFTLGKALVTEIRQTTGGPALYQKIEFAVEANPLARIAYKLYQGKFLRAVSVGFIPLRWENGDSSSALGPSEKRAGGGPGFRRRYLEQELLEVSAVGIPANPEALALGFQSGAIDKADIEHSLALLDRALSDFRSTVAVLNPHSRARGVQSNGAQLLRLARAFRDVLKRS
jgi:hypothetical protein